MHPSIPLRIMTDRGSRRTMLLFAGLSVYIVLQFIWWGILLLRKDREVTALAIEVTALGGNTTADLEGLRGWRMVMGEGTVLLILLLTGLLLTYRAIRRDLAMARAQRNFLLAVTHELRTPIAAIKLQLQTIGREALAPEQQQQLRQGAIDEADRLASLTDKVLLATQADEGLLRLESVQVDVAATLASLLEQVRTRCAGSHMLHYTGPASHFANTDPEALRSIASNLLENAIKYAPAGSTVQLQLMAGKDGWRMSISDQGPGIPENERERIFERFFRGGHEETRQTKGTGLGLYIVKRLVEALGGNILVLQQKPTGTIFTLSFPQH